MQCLRGEDRQGRPLSLVFDRYARDEPLGKGALAVVHAASGPQGRVALKETDLRHLEALRVEATYLKRLSHRGVPSVHEVGEHEGRAVLAMGLMVGEPLRMVLANSPTPAQAALIGANLAEILEAVHSAGLVHCDVKAANVLVDADFRVSLVDFDVAVDAQTPFDSSAPRASVHTAAPEQVSGGPATSATDIYALGALLYRMLTGRYPFHSSNPATAMAQHLNAQPPMIDADLPEDLVAVAMQCLEKDPAARPTAPEVRTRLLAVHKATSRSNLALAVGLAVIAALAITAAYYGFR